MRPVVLCIWKNNKESFENGLKLSSEYKKLNKAILSTMYNQLILYIYTIHLLYDCITTYPYKLEAGSCWYLLVLIT